MWWECQQCVSGGNSPKTAEAHRVAYPHHVIVEEHDAPEEAL